MTSTGAPETNGSSSDASTRTVERALRVLRTPAGHASALSAPHRERMRGWSAGMRSATPRRMALTLLAATVGAVGLYLWRGFEPVLVFIACTLATGLLIPPVAQMAWKKGMLAYPGGRDIHEKPTPHGGGLALAVPIFCLLLTLGLTGSTAAWGLLGGGALIFAVGMLDDMKRASPKLKICVQVAAAGALLLGGYELPALGVPGLGTFELGAAGPFVLVAWIVLATNAFNLSDGLDGLATSLAILGLAVLTAADVGGLLPVALAGACLGFLHYNLPQARIFLGDSGSLLLGFLLAALALTLPIHANLPVALAVFAYSLGDVLIVSFRRWIRAKPIFSPDRSHVHHKVLEALGHRPLLTLVAILVIAGVQGLLAALWPGLVSITVSGLVWFVVAALLIRAGHYAPGQFKDGRKPMRELHLLRKYVVGNIEMARSPAQVDRFLHHLAESADLCALGLGYHVIRRAESCDHRMLGGASVVAEGEACRIHRIVSADCNCWWRARPDLLNRALEQERAIIAKEALEAAHAAYERLGGLPREILELAPSRRSSTGSQPELAEVSR